MTVKVRYILPVGHGNTEFVDVEHTDVKETGFGHGTYWLKTPTKTYRYGVPTIVEIEESNE